MLTKRISQNEGDNAMTKKYALKGINDEESVCVVCGKVELKRVMWVVEIDSDKNEAGEPFHCGTTCGAKLLGQKISHINAVVKNFAAVVRTRRMDLQMARERELGREQILAQLTGLSFSERIVHPLWADLNRINAEAKSWADAQIVNVEI